MDFARVAPYLKDELVLVGFVVFLFFSFSRYLIKRGIIPALPPTLGFRALKLILLYGFLLGIVISGLGFGLKYRELSKAEQRAALSLIDGELEGNLRVQSELVANVGVIVKLVTGYADSLRTPGNKVMATMFPRENADRREGTPPARQLAEQAFETIKRDGLYRDPILKGRFNQAARYYYASTRTTLPTVESLRDNGQTRYRIRDDVWRSQLPILRRIDIFPVTDFQKSYEHLRVLRASYEVVVSNAARYIEVLNDFFDQDKKITSDRLGAVLASERLMFDVVQAYLAQTEQSSLTLRDLDARVKEMEKRSD